MKRLLLVLLPLFAVTTGALLAYNRVMRERMVAEALATLRPEEINQTIRVIRLDKPGELGEAHCTVPLGCVDDKTGLKLPEKVMTRGQFAIHQRLTGTPTGAWPFVVLMPTVADFQKECRRLRVRGCELVSAVN